MNQETRNYEAELLKKCKEDTENLLKKAEERHILDSGNRRTFESGAVRDIQEGKGRCDLLPLKKISNFFIYLSNIRDLSEDENNKKWVKYADILISLDTFMKNGNEEYIIEVILDFCEGTWSDPYTAVLELSKHYEEGAKKYDERNWEKGISAHCYIDSGIRHLTKYFRGDQDEPHDRAFLWNMFGLLWTIENKPECNDLPYVKELGTTTEKRGE